MKSQIKQLLFFLVLDTVFMAVVVAGAELHSYLTYENPEGR